jgi:HEAT repeat protein
MQAESARIQRFLDVPNNTALTTILELADSKDVNERRFAADVLTHLDHPIARTHLLKLAKVQFVAEAGVYFQDMKTGAIESPKQFHREYP